MVLFNERRPAPREDKLRIHKQQKQPNGYRGEGLRDQRQEQLRIQQHQRQHQQRQRQQQQGLLHQRQLAAIRGPLAPPRLQRQNANNYRHNY
jgi:hypothetical protein